MKTNPLRNRTLKAMGMGLAVFGGLVLSGFSIAAVISGTNPLNELLQIGVIVIIISLFAMTGWAMVIWPLTRVRGIEKLLGHVYLTEVIWVLLALLAFGVLVTSWVGLDSRLIVWIPATIGLSVGLSFRWLGATNKSPPTISNHNTGERRP